MEWVVQSVCEDIGCISTNKEYDTTRFTADVSARIKNMTQQDLHYANEHLDPNCFGTSIHQNCDNIYKFKKKTTDIPQTTKNLFWDRAPLTVGWYFVVWNRKLKNDKKNSRSGISLYKIHSRNQNFDTITWIPYFLLHEIPQTLYGRAINSYNRRTKGYRLYSNKMRCHLQSFEIGKNRLPILFVPTPIAV